MLTLTGVNPRGEGSEKRRCVGDAVDGLRGELVGDASDFAIEDAAIVGEPRIGVIQNGTEGTLGVVIDESGGKFGDGKFGGGGLRPKLHGEGVSGFGEAEAIHGADTVGLVAAEGIGEIQTETLVDFAGEDVIDAATLWRNPSGSLDRGHVAAAADDVGGVGCGGGEEFGELLWLVLIIAIQSDHPIEFFGGGKTEGIAD